MPKAKVKESKKDKAVEADEEDPKAKGGAGDPEDSQDGGGQDDDSSKDIALIKKMIAEYVGGDGKDASSEEQEALAGLAKEAYEGHKEMCSKENEASKEKKSDEEIQQQAYERAGHAIKLAHHMASKQKQAETEEAASDDDQASDDKAKKAPPKKAAPAAKDDDGDDDGGDDESESDESKESKREKVLSKKLLEAEGRIAALEAKDKQSETSRYVEAQLVESKQPKSVTKRFREAASPFHSKKDFDSKWKVFQEGLKNFQPEIDWTAVAEKSTSSEDGSRSESKVLDFSECAE